MPPQPRVPALRGPGVIAAEPGTPQKGNNAQRAMVSSHGPPAQAAPSSSSVPATMAGGYPSMSSGQMPMGYGGYGGYGGMGMGMGMGMGYGGMGGMGYYGGGMMNPMMGILSGPLSLIYSINYLIGSLGQIMELLGMNSQALLQTYRTAYDAYIRVVEQIRTSETRRWLQRKCKKSALLRFLLVTASCAVVAAAMRVLGSYLSWRRARMLMSSAVGGDAEGNPNPSFTSLLFGGGVGGGGGASSASSSSSLSAAARDMVANT